MEFDEDDSGIEARDFSVNTTKGMVGWLKKKGIVTMRFSNEATRNNTSAVVSMIKAKVKQRLP